MNTSWRARAALVYVLLFIALVFKGLPALGAPAEPPLHTSSKVIFLVDASLSMSKKRPAVARTVRYQLAGNLMGQLQEGESYQIWFFNDRVETSAVPVASWNSSRREALAEVAEQAILRHKFGGSSRPGLGIQAIKRALKSSPEMLVFLFTDGDAPISGTPFDADINVIFTKFLREPNPTHKPLLTVLRGQGGQLVSWVAHGRDSIITLPAEVQDFAEDIPSDAPVGTKSTGLTQTPPRETLPPVQLAELVPPATIAKPAPSEIIKPAKAAQPIEPLPAPLEVVAPATTKPVVTAPTEISAATSPLSTTGPTQPRPESVPVAMKQQAAPAIVTPPLVTSNESTVTVKSDVDRSPAPPKSSAPGVDEPRVIAPVAMVENPAAAKLNLWPALVGGIAAVALIVLLLKRRGTHRPSLISRGIDSRRK